MLAVGSIVYLKEGTRKIVIINRGPVIEIDGEELLFDYIGCLYPQGFELDKNLYFNEENIEEVLFEGYVDEEELGYRALYVEWLKSDENPYKKGVVKTKL